MLQILLITTLTLAAASGTFLIIHRLFNNKQIYKDWCENPANQQQCCK